MERKAPLFFTATLTAFGRDSLNGHSPYELSLLLLDNKLHKALGLKAIAPDDVMLSPSLLK